MNLSKKIYSFTMTSGVGWLLSVIVLWLGVNLLSTSPFVANFIGDSLAITYVFFTASKKIFVHRRKFMPVKFFIYSCYQFFLITMISEAVQRLTEWSPFLIVSSYGISVELAAKILITPVTLLLNFTVAYVLIEQFDR